MNTLMVDFRRNQANSLGLVAADEAAESSRNEDRSQIGGIQTRLTQQNGDTGPDRPATQLQFPDIPLRQRDRSVSRIARGLR